jgi:HAD superfamily hydrolase (TIGR01459 family)
VTRSLSGLGAIAPHYDVAFCDIWGVIHNGHAVFDGVEEALIAYRRQGGIVVLVSNAPRPSETVVPQLDRLAFSHQCWDAIVTSGDVTRSLIAQQVGRTVFHLGPGRDHPLLEGHALSLVGPETAEVIVCTGLFDDTTETPDTYRDMLAGFRARSVPMICANPDLVVERGGKMIYCAGAIAQAYEAIGGVVTSCGKPHRPIYDAAIDVAESLTKRRVDPRRILAIGDSVRTDLAGAAALGCGALFVAGGIHAVEAGHGAVLDDEALARFLSGSGASPDYAMARLVW